AARHETASAARLKCRPIFRQNAAQNTETMDIIGRLRYWKIQLMDYTPRPHTPPIASEKIASDRKIFFIDLKENDRGRFLKITEDVSGRRDTIMVPMAALPEFVTALERLIEYEGQL